MKRGVFLLSIGDEILDGRIQNSNATWFGEELRMAGVTVREIRAVSDDPLDIIRALREAGKKSTLVIATGGLGPTNDDRTVASAARAFGKKVIQNKTALAQVRACYKARNLPLTEQRLRLALAPQGAKVIKNLAGTAPGLHCVFQNSDFFLLPGPPNECRPMFTKNILPRARRLAQHRIVRREFWRTFGRGESDVYQSIAPVVTELEKSFPSTIRFGVHISFPCVDLTLEVLRIPGAKIPSKTVVDRAVAAISTATQEICFTRNRESLVECVARQLLALKKTVVVAESCTGGLLGKMLTDLPGSSQFFLGGVITYANSAKEILVQVPRSVLEKEGAVSEATVGLMAENTRRKLGGDYALALSGVSGPGGGSELKPVGTLCAAISSASGTKTLHQFILSGRGSRDQNRVIAAHIAFNALRAEILVSHGNRIQLS